MMISYICSYKISLVAIFFLIGVHKIQTVQQKTIQLTFKADVIANENFAEFPPLHIQATVPDIVILPQKEFLSPSTN